MLSNVYNKSIFFHLNPQGQSIHIYELDPTFSYKNQHTIALPSPSSLYQMQTLDNLLVVHNLSEGHSQLYDLKLPDYSTGVLTNPVRIPSDRYPAGIFLSDLLSRDEHRGNSTDETYTKPVMRGDGMVVDPGATHVIKDAEVVEIDEGVGAQSPYLEPAQALTPSVYSNQNLFVDPCYIIDVSQTFTCTSLYLSLDRFTGDRVVTEDLRCLLSLLNRSRSKAVMNAHMGKLLVLKRLSLLDLSKVMMRMNGVYK